MKKTVAKSKVVIGTFEYFTLKDNRNCKMWPVKGLTPNINYFDPNLLIAVKIKVVKHGNK